MKQIIACVLFYLLVPAFQAAAQENFVTSKKGDKDFTLVSAGAPATLYGSDSDHPGVLRALKDLQQDIAKVTDAQPQLLFTKPAGKEVIIAGTIGKSPVIDDLVKRKKLAVKDVAEKWETFVLQVIDKPMKGVDRALVIAGSDKRGTIFGIYELSKQIGVSPWYWWADVPVKKNSSLYIKPGRYVFGEPAVKYRGIFINDEEPALGRWAVEKYGGFNHTFYEKVFELILRMKGNYLWPAMWWASFNTDDTLNPRLADEYGIVMSTTHHEPMMRAHAEWKKFNGSAGAWNYETNSEKLRSFWKEGIQRMGDRESIISLGMRGDGDMAMTAETNISLLERIVKDQRDIITEVTAKDATKTPQLWALYKEVQDYYDKGMRAPDDVTLLLCDDNWGNIRKLPKVGDSRSGSYGIYYHFDYVGGPRNYKWVNTNPIPRVWEQMHLAYRYGANRIWLVNVGDIKPMEFPIEFFLDYAWDPTKLDHTKLGDYTTKWAGEQFGSAYASEIGAIIARFAKYNGRRKPELLSPNTYSLIHYREAETIVADYNKLTEDAEKIYATLPPEYKDAYYQLVLYPVKASANLNELFVTVGKNRLYSTQGRSTANDLAQHAKTLFEKDADLSKYYNKTMAGGKWNHMADQTHISYTYWQQPPVDVLPEVKEVELAAGAEMGVAIEGSLLWWPLEKGEAELPAFDNFNNQTSYFEIFNRGTAPINYTAKAAEPWVMINLLNGEVKKEQRVYVSIDWKKAPIGKHKTQVTITDKDGKSVIVHVSIRNNMFARPDQLKGFIEGNGYVSMEAEHFSKAINTASITWQVIPDLGRTQSGVTVFPVTASRQTPGKDSPHLEYEINLYDSGDIDAIMYFSPTIDFTNSGGLQYAISFDDEPVQVINIHSDNSNLAWEKSVGENIIKSISKHSLKNSGRHTLKLWMVDPGLVLQKLVVETKKIGESYLGPPESYRK